MKFAIPSYARYETLNKKTLSFLLRHKIDKKDIYLFIREDDKDIDSYKGLGCNVIVTRPQLCGDAHNSITNYFEEGEYIIELDDDMDELRNEKREAITDFKKECELMKCKLDEYKCSYGGTYSVDNPLFMSGQSKFTTDLRYMLGCVRFRYIRKDIQLEMKHADDFEMILKHYVRDGKIVKNNHLAPKTKIYAKGGQDGAGRTIETEKKEKIALNNMFPDLTKVFERKNGRWDLRLKDNTFKNSLKNNVSKYNIMSVKIDDSVKIIGGKSNKCEGVITSLKNVFVLVRITKDKMGKPVFGDKPIKVKKSYLEVIEPPPIEMPTQEDLVVVDTPNNQEKDIFETIDKVIKENKKVTIKEVVEEIKESKPYVPPSVLVNENNVASPTPTIDDALNWQKDNQKLNLQLQSMLGFQMSACSEIADLKMRINELKEQLNDSVRKEHVEKMFNELKNMIE